MSPSTISAILVYESETKNLQNQSKITKLMSFYCDLVIFVLVLILWLGALHGKLMVSHYVREVLKHTSCVTETFHCTLLCDSSIQSKFLHPISLRFILILYLITYLSLYTNISLNMLFRPILQVQDHPYSTTVKINA